jgi:peptidyl-lysine (3S)-dioxygenase / protease
MSENQAIIDALRHQSCELRDLDIGYTVPRVSSLTALQFLRDFVSCNKPVIFTDVVNHWPALTLWNKDYLIEKAGTDPVTVALTPDGRADCPIKIPPSSLATATGSKDEQLCFAFPYQRKTSLSTFFNLLEASLVDQSAPVPYMQFQNSSLTNELPQLIPDVAPDLPFASEAFGCLPEAVNLWIGGKRTITSYHKDHYENLYAVISGSKHFRLLPPTDSYRMKLKRFPPATWHLKLKTTIASDSSIESNLLLEEEELRYGDLELKINQPATAAAVAAGKTTNIGSVGEDYIIWSEITPTPLNNPSPSPNPGAEEEEDEQQEIFDLYKDPSLPKPLIVTLQPGEMLYLPACWWHEVHHEHPENGSTSNQLHATDNNEDSNGGTSEGSSNNNNDISIAVNYWYDMKFDVKYATMKALEELAIAAALNEGEI